MEKATRTKISQFEIGHAKKLIQIDGIADLNVWDVDTHALWKRAISF